MRRARLRSSASLREAGHRRFSVPSGQERVSPARRRGEERERPDRGRDARLGGASAMPPESVGAVRRTEGALARRARKAAGVRLSARRSGNRALDRIKGGAIPLIIPIIR